MPLTSVTSTYSRSNIGRGSASIDVNGQTLTDFNDMKIGTILNSNRI